ncbi:hypothetical protein FH972_023680 [Carpinus fangiana]|uniref:purine-nucleoside phosphorylase n=1 Tax=Carpinus fangiana TaxID=176857 RepID=A0A5N6KVW7_9ROSI|nr:hypothetical protein FH972_023680 [Carpinus fangiana]
MLRFFHTFVLDSYFAMAAGMEETATPGAFVRATEAANFLLDAAPKELCRPKVAIVCGSGLGGLQNTIQASPKFEIPYAQIPHFPKSTVQGHEGKMVFGMLGTVQNPIPVVLLVGRAHFYEGHSMDLVTFATRVCKRLNVGTMIVTNAAGGLNPDYSVGDIVLLNDHLNLAGLVGIHPLRGPNEESFGVRFPPLSDAYDLALRRLAHRAWANLSPPSQKKTLQEGIYAFVGGPTYETRAECRMLRLLGADLVGMSTVPEIIAARHSGMRVLAFSLCTNCAVLEAGPRGDDATLQGLSVAEMEAQLSKGKANHEEVLDAGKAAAETMQDLVREIVGGIDF